MSKGFNHELLARLVVMSLGGDSNAFAELYTLTYNYVYNYARHYLNDDESAQDALQDIYVVVLKNLQKLHNPRLFIAWLNKICFSVCYRITQHQSSDTYSLDSDEGLIEVLASSDMNVLPESKYMHSEVLKQLALALDQLSDEQNQIIKLRYYSNMTVAEISNVLNLSQSTVKRHIKTATAALRFMLRDSLNDGGDIFENF